MVGAGGSCFIPKCTKELLHIIFPTIQETGGGLLDEEDGQHVIDRTRIP